MNGLKKPHIEQMRNGLFRVHFDFGTSTQDKICCVLRKNFQLLGSYSDKLYQMTYTFKPNNGPHRMDYSYEYGIILEELPSRSAISDTVKNAESSSSVLALCLNGPPVRIWMDYEDVVDTTHEELVFESRKSLWHLECLCTRKPFSVTLFIDYGSTETVEKQMVNRLVDMFIAQKLCDVQFQFEDKTSVGAHSIILASGSPVFFAMFQCGLSESQTRTVTINDFDTEVFCQLILFLYTGTAPKIQEERITQSLFVASDKYDVESLKKDCVNALKKQLNITNAISMLVWAQFYSANDLIDQAMKFVVENCNELSGQPEWVNLMQNNRDLSLLCGFTEFEELEEEEKEAVLENEEQQQEVGTVHESKAEPSADPAGLQEGPPNASSEVSESAQLREDVAEQQRRRSFKRPSYSPPKRQKRD